MERPLKTNYPKRLKLTYAKLIPFQGYFLLLNPFLGASLCPNSRYANLKKKNQIRIENIRDSLPPKRKITPSQTEGGGVSQGERKDAYKRAMENRQTNIEKKNSRTERCQTTDCTTLCS